jgi:hypothetical protein
MRHKARIVADVDLELSVDNDGPGIPVEAREPFFRSQMTRQSQVPGHGLGLAVCRSIVEAHGGRIWVYDQSRQGHAFQRGPSVTALRAAPGRIPRELAGCALPQAMDIAKIMGIVVDQFADMAYVTMPELTALFLVLNITTLILAAADY